MGNTQQREQEEVKVPTRAHELMQLYERASQITTLSQQVAEECSITAKRSQREIRVCFVGLGKAGKSTLVNSLVGLPICPMGDLNETTIATLIMDTDARALPRCFEGHIHRPFRNASHYVEIEKVDPSSFWEGQDIYQGIHQKNAEMREGLTSQPAIYGHKLKEDCLIIEAKLNKNWLLRERLGNARLVLIDTPGINEDLIEEQFRDLIGYLNCFSDLIVYVVNVREAFSSTIMNQLRSSIVHFKEWRAMHISQGFILVLNHIDEVDDAHETMNGWNDKLKSICEELKVNYDEFAVRVCYLSAKSLFLSNEIERYAREQLRANPPRIITREAERLGRDVVSYVQGYQENSTDSQRRKQLHTMLSKEISTTLNNKDKEFAEHVKKAVGLIQELMTSYVTQSNPEEREATVSSLERLKEQIRNLNAQRYQPRVEEFNTRVTELCHAITQQITEIQQHSNEVTFSYPEISKRLITPFNAVLQEYTSGAKEDIKKIKKLVTDNRAFRLHQNLEVVLASWEQNMSYSSENCWTTGEVVAAGAVAGLGIGAAVGGTFLLSIVCPPCGIVATGAQIVGYLGGGGLAGGAVVGAASGIVNRLVNDNSKVIAALEKEKHKLSSLHALPLKIEDVILLIDTTQEHIRGVSDAVMQAAQSVIADSQQYILRLGV